MPDLLAVNRWWWLSLVIKGSNRFLGVIVLEADDPQAAVTAIDQVQGVPEDVEVGVKASSIPASFVDASVPRELRGRFISENEMKLVGLK